MSGSTVRYLGWWVRDYKDTVLVIAAPLAVIAGILAIGESVLTGDLAGLPKSLGVVALGLFIILWPLLRYRGKAKPWHQPH